MQRIITIILVNTFISSFIPSMGMSRKLLNTKAVCYYKNNRIKNDAFKLLSHPIFMRDSLYFLKPFTLYNNQISSFHSSNLSDTREKDEHIYCLKRKIEKLQKENNNFKQLALQLHLNEAINKANGAIQEFTITFTHLPKPLSALLANKPYRIKIITEDIFSFIKNKGEKDICLSLKSSGFYTATYTLSENCTVKIELYNACHMTSDFHNELFRLLHTLSKMMHEQHKDIDFKDHHDHTLFKSSLEHYDWHIEYKHYSKRYTDL